MQAGDTEQMPRTHARKTIRQFHRQIIFHTKKHGLQKPGGVRIKELFQPPAGIFPEKSQFFPAPGTQAAGVSHDLHIVGILLPQNSPGTIKSPLIKLPRICLMFHIFDFSLCPYDRTNG